MESERPNTDDEQPSPQLNSYCEECLERILIPVPKYQEHKFSSILHHNLSDLVDCREHCQLCKYICSLFGLESLSQIISNHPLQVLRVLVYHDIIVPNLDENKVFNYANMRISVQRELPSSYAKKDTVTIEERMFTVCTNTARAFGRPVWNSPDRLDFETRSSTIRDWIKECDTTHHNCSDIVEPDQRLAARILHVEILGSNKCRVKLISTQNINLHKERYFVLSHVWGDIDITCKTTTKNITRYLEEGIYYNELPQTFKDAVKITAVVGLRYIWIDSLCIVQDDNEDWQREAAKMASIYRGATLTISATSAHNSLGGCGISAMVDPALQLPGCSKSPLGLAIQGPEYGKSMELLRDQMIETPVSARAWIFQEQILSLRTLHMAHSQFVWQCVTHIESEDGLHYQDHRLDTSVRWPICDRVISRLQPLAQEKAVADLYELEKRWWSWVNTYTSRTLKYKSDQFAALAGIVRFYQDIANDEPVVGLWQKNLPLHLSWVAHRDEYEYHHTTALPQYGTRRPSWTWMSYPHGCTRISGPRVEWNKLEKGSDPKDIGIVYQATAIGTNITWSGEPLTSMPSGTIRIRGIINQKPRPPKPRQPGFQVHLMILDPELPESVTSRENFWTVALVAYIQSGLLITDPPTLWTFYLIVEPIGSPELNEYVRIGWMRIWQQLPEVTMAKYRPEGALGSIDIL